MDIDIWLSNSYALLEKFQTAVFWEHPGSGSSENSSRPAIPGTLTTYDGDCVEWPGEVIVNIDGIEKIGETNLHNEHISSQCRLLSLFVKSIEIID
jgi:hypothetical protein